MEGVLLGGKAPQKILSSGTSGHQSQLITMGLIVAAVVAGFSWRVVPMTTLPRELGRNGELFSGREFYRFFTRWFHCFFRLLA